MLVPAICDLQTTWYEVSYRITHQPRTGNIRRRFHRTAFVLLALAATASVAQAENPIYLTGKLGNTSLDANLGDGFSQIIDGDDNSWTFGLGARFGDYLVFQAEYHDFGSVPGLGSPCPNDGGGCVAEVVPVEADSSAVSVSFLPQFPLGERAFVYGKIGFVSWESDVSEAVDAGSEFIDDFSDEELLYGAGFRYMLPGPFAAFAEYEKISDTFETISLGVTWGF